MLQTGIWEVFGLNLGRKTSYSDIFMAFLSPSKLSTLKQVTLLLLQTTL